MWASPPLVLVSFSTHRTNGSGIRGTSFSISRNEIWDLLQRLICGITLKALANFSPEFALKPAVDRTSLNSRNSERVATWFLQSYKRKTQPLTGLRLLFYGIALIPGLPKRNPGLELANA